MHDNDEYLTTEELDDTRPARAVDDEMDLTPMVDVTFLLLIFFMITAAFAVQKAISVPPTNDQTTPTQSVEDLEDDSIVIRIDADNVFWIGAPRWAEEQQAMSASEMRRKVREARDDDVRLDLVGVGGLDGERCDQCPQVARAAGAKRDEEAC